jgi:hypothetical protein
MARLQADEAARDEHRKVPEVAVARLEVEEALPRERLAIWNRNTES